MYDLDMEIIGQKIRDYRKVNNMNIEELGNIIGKSKGTITRYENGEITMDLITVLEICNALNLDLNDICKHSSHSMEKNADINPFNNNLLYLYYISKQGIVISSLEIEKKNSTNYVLMKNGIHNNKYKQEYTGILECSYNTAFFCLTNAITNPGLDKFQIEMDLHSKSDNLYFGLFLGISNNTHKPTARKCILTTEFIQDKERLSELFEKLKVTEQEASNMLETKYWDMKITEYVIKL